MKISTKFNYIFIISIFFSSFLFVLSPKLAKAEYNPPGVLDEPWDESVEYICNYDVKSDPFETWSEGIIPLLPSTLPSGRSLKNHPYIDSPNSAIPPDYYIEAGELYYTEAIAYVPVILVETEEWYSHKFELTTTTTQTTEFSYTFGVGARRGMDQLRFEYGETTTTTTQMVSGWVEHVPAGETWVIYVMMTFVRLYGEFTYWIQWPEEGAWTETHEYDGVYLQEIMWDNIYTLKYSVGETPVELPSGIDPYLDPTPYSYLPSELSFEWSQIESHTTTVSLNFQYLTGMADWTGIFATLECNWVVTQTNEFAFKHTFIKELENTNQQFFDYFYIRYDNALSVNLDPTHRSEGEITSPSDGQKILLGDNVPIMSTASDAEGVDRVQYRIGPSGSWVNAYFDSFYQRWIWWWYDQPSTGMYNIDMRVLDDKGHITNVDSIEVNVDYGTMKTYLVSPIKYSSCIGGTTQGKNDDDTYFKIRTTGIGWWRYESIARFYFYSYTELITVKLELQITPCNPNAEIRIKYTDGYLTGWSGLAENTYNTQTKNLDPNRKVEYVEIRQFVWWTSGTWIYIDFVWIRYRIY